MRLTFLGKTSNSGDGQCPALYETDRGTYVVQGKIVTDRSALGDIRDLGPDETIVEIPADVLELRR